MLDKKISRSLSNGLSSLGAATVLSSLVLPGIPTVKASERYDGIATPLSAISLSMRPTRVPVNGTGIPELRVYDDLMQEYMTNKGIPGGTLVIVKQGHVLYSKGFGFANIAKQEPFTSDHTTFHYGSVTKALTGLTCLKLTEEGKLDLDKKFLSYIKLKQIKGKSDLDPRVSQISLRDLMTQWSGLTSEKNVVWPSEDLIRTVGNKDSISRSDLISWALNTGSLACPPESKFNYANVNFLILGQVIEDEERRPYKEVVNNILIKPSGATSILVCSDKNPSSVFNRATPYNLDDSAGLKESTGSNYEYGLCDACGGLEGTACDLAKVLTYGLGMDRKNRLFSSDSSYNNLFNQNFYNSHHSDNHYSGGFYWYPRNVDSRTEYSFRHGGLTDGTSCLIQSRYDGTMMIVAFNANNAKGSLCEGIAQSLQDVADKVKWEDIDLSTKQ